MDGPKQLDKKRGLTPRGYRLELKVGFVAPQTLTLVLMRNYPDSLRGGIETGKKAD
jgi:hypothetical protein